MTWYTNILISSLSYYNWIYDLWFSFTHRLGKAWSAYGAEEGIWHINHIGNKAYAYPADMMAGDRPKWIFNAEHNYLIDTTVGQVDVNDYHRSAFIGGSLYQNNIEYYDMTDFISSVRIFGSQPPIQIIIWAWAIKTSKECVGWLEARRDEVCEARMLNREADEEIYNV